MQDQLREFYAESSQLLLLWRENKDVEISGEKK